MDIFANHRVNAYEDLFDLDLDDLTDESPKANHPDSINIKLKEHQLTILSRCMEFENKALKLKDFKSIADQCDNDDYFNTNIGVIADRVGSGKSYVVLSLIVSNNIRDKERIFVRSTGLNNVVYNLRDKTNVIKTNIIVVPFSLCSQWEGYVKQFKNDIPYKIVNKNKHITDLVGSVVDKIKDIDILIVTSTFFNKFADIAKRENIRFQRIFFDEADTLSINNCSHLDANFTWFVTASYGNILYPKGFAKQERHMNRYIWCAEGLRHSGFIKNVFIDTHYTIPRSILKTLIIKNSEAYVQRSIDLPSLNTCIVKCKTPNSINVLNGLVDKNIINCLNGGDVQRALQYISPHQKMTEENIISVIIDKYQKNLNNIDVRISMIDQLHFDDPNEKTRELQSLTTKKTEITTNIQLIKERIQNNNMCYICYDDHDNKTIVKCCQNSFCFKCISMWLSQKALCPLCKAHLTTNELFVSSSENAALDMEEQFSYHIVGNIKGFSSSYTKVKNLENLLRSKQDFKMLIFSGYDSSFTSVTPILDELGILYDYLKGNGGHINNVIDNYKNGDTNILLVNTRYYGSGFNMENTTDIVMFHKFDSEIEKQVVGRAQRFGRKDSLNVWYLMYENE